jgi:hypothetical protein
MKLCIRKAMLTGIGKAECNTHTISGTLSVDSSQNMLFITTYVLQFHNTANTTKQMPDTKYSLTYTHTHNKRHYCSYVNEKCTKSKSGALGHPEKISRDTRTFLGRTVQTGTLVMLHLVIHSFL